MPRRDPGSCPSPGGCSRETRRGSSWALEVLSLLELWPALAEGAGRDGRQVAGARPLSEEERKPSQPAVPDEGPLSDAAECRAEAEERGRRHDPPGKPEDHPFGPRRDLLPVELHAEIHQHPRDVDAHRANVLTRAAE